MSEPPTRERDDSIDLLRGVAMVAMALDHARDFFGDAARDPMGLATTDYPLFFTRFVTHYCAPTFVFLAGVSAWLGSRRRTPAVVSRDLVFRGLWLVVLELTIVRFGWRWELDYARSTAQVIWAIGWSMVALALVSRAGPRFALVFGAALIVGHDLFDTIHADRFGSWGWLWRVLHDKGRIEPIAGHTIYIAYPLVPWVGVMAAGFGLGRSLEKATPERKRWLLALGGALTGLFVVLRLFGVYGDPSPFSTQPRSGYSLLSFFDVTKYPPSLEYLCMTLGPALLAWGLVSGRRLSFARPVITFGRVPLFYYLLHLLLLHGMAKVYLYWQGGGAAVQAAIASKHGTDASLAVVYAAWILGVSLLYPVCRWFELVKARHRASWWTAYI